MKKTKKTVTIEEWIEARGGKPAIIKGTDDLLRVKFDELNNDLEEISWAEFFKLFKENDLEFIYDESKDSRFCKFIAA